MIQMVRFPQNLAQIPILTKFYSRFGVKLLQKSALIGRDEFFGKIAKIRPMGENRLQSAARVRGSAMGVIGGREYAMGVFGRE